MRVLILFSTSEGHTRKITRFLSDRLAGQGHEVRMADAENLPTEIMRSLLPLGRRIEGIPNEATITMLPLPLERIAAPTLVISARDDLYNTLPAAEHLAEHIPGARPVVLDSGGHLMVGQRHQGDRVVSDFIKSIGT